LPGAVGPKPTGDDAVPIKSDPAPATVAPLSGTGGDVPPAPPAAVKASVPAQTAAPVAAQTATPAQFLSRPGSLGAITQIGCTSCGSLPSVAPLTGASGYDYGVPGCGGGCAGCGEGGCVTGRPSCETCESDSCLGRFFCSMHNAICCPDPCYEPQWVPTANAALFVPTVRPNTYTRIRWDYGNNLTSPDRAQYFWKTIGSGGPTKAENALYYHDLSVYNEFGTDKFSAFVELPYRSVHPDDNVAHGSFADMSFGSKAVVIDSELVLTTFQFKTTVPTGNPTAGTGTGHVSLEPSMLYAVKLAEDTYWQGQLGWWIPLGTSGNSGGVIEYNNSLNCVLWRPLHDTLLIGTIESTGYTFTAGQVTSPFVDANGKVVQRSAQTTYFNLGPGFRWSVCNRAEFGFGVQFALTKEHFADQLYRTEIRFRY
jgi:hypothetical protein